MLSTPTASATSHAPASAPVSRRLGLGALLALICAVAACLFTTYLTARSLARGVRAQAAERFELVAERVVHEVHLRLSLFEHGLRGTRGVFNASRDVGRAEFHTYTQSRDLVHEFIGMRSHGYLARVRRADLDAFVAANRADGMPDFTVRSKGDAPELFVIQFAEPLEPLRSLIGLDVMQEPIRRDAALRAMRSGEAVLTPRVALLQDPEQRGVIYILPVYRHGMPTGTVAQREAACVGWIFFAIAMNEVLHAIPEVASGQLDMDLFDGPAPSPDTNLYDADGQLKGQQGIVDARSYSDRMFWVRRPLHLGGRVWTLWLSSLPPFSSKVDYSGVTAVAILGSLLSLLVGGVIWTLGTARSRALGLAQDMTGDLQAARDAAAEREHLLRTIIDLLPQRVFWKDREGRYLGCNRAFLQDTGLADVVGRTDRDMPWRPEEAAWYELCDRRVIESAQAEVDIVESLHDADGRDRWLLTNKVPLRDKDGAVVAVLGTYQDVTPTKEREAELARLRDAAEEASRAKSEFLANMSHEIRTPLTAILGYTDVLRDDEEIAESPARRAEVLKTIRAAGQHLLTVINDILDLSKIEAGKVALEEIETELPRLLRDIVSIVLPRATDKGLTLAVVLEGQVPRWAIVDPTRLRQVLLNLVGNAIKFTEQGGVTLRVVASAAESALTIDIEDTGAGLSEAQAQALFRPFSQADSSVTRTHGGTGLGLSISRRLARLMGGDVTLRRSAPGQGTCFRCAVALRPVPGTPWVDELPREGRASEPRHSLHPVRLKGRILLAEDGRDNQRLIAFILRKAGAEVQVADNGRVAMEMMAAAEAEGHPYDMLLTDVQMPEMDGHTLTRQLRARGAQIPVVALTAHAMAEDRQRCLEAGCDDYTTKPVDRQLLLSVCERWLAQRPQAPGPLLGAGPP